MPIPAMEERPTLEGPDALHKNKSSGDVRLNDEMQTKTDDRQNWTEPNEVGLPDDHRAIGLQIGLDIQMNLSLTALMRRPPAATSSQHWCQKWDGVDLVLHTIPRQRNLTNCRTRNCLHYEHLGSQLLGAINFFPMIFFWQVFVLKFKILACLLLLRKSVHVLYIQVGLLFGHMRTV